MSSSSNSSSVSVSNKLSVTLQDEEYFLVEKLKEVQRKAAAVTPSKSQDEGKADQKLQSPLANVLGSRGSGGRALGSCRTCLIYDFTITPSTSSALSTSIALQPSQDVSFSDHFRYLFQEVCMERAEIDLDFHKYSNLTGESGVLPAFIWAWVPAAFTSTQTYADVSNYTTARNIAWSPQKPCVRYLVPPSWLKKTSWTNGVEASTAGDTLSKWAATNRFASGALSMGFVHIATQDATGVASRPILGRLKMWCTFRNRI